MISYLSTNYSLYNEYSYQYDKLMYENPKIISVFASSRNKKNNDVKISSINLKSTFLRSFSPSPF